MIGRLKCFFIFLLLIIACHQASAQSSVLVNPGSDSVPTGFTQGFTATAFDSHGHPMSPQPAFTWLVTGGGTIDGTGLFTAGSTPGGPFTVSAMAGTVWGTAQVTVIAPPPFVTVSTLYDLNGYSGGSPLGALVEGMDGRFYGTCEDGGVFTYGTVFGITPRGQLSVLHNFAGYPTDGGLPFSTLIQTGDGMLYGTAREGNINGFGCVFACSTSGSYNSLHTFLGTDGAWPESGLLEGADGVLYGTTTFGDYYSDCSNGDVFQITPTGVFNVIHAFGTTGSIMPTAGLVQGADGSFYGATSGGPTGGPHGIDYGTIFKITTDGQFTTLYTFNGTDGAEPMDALVQGTDGGFYGTTKGGGVGHTYNQSGAGVVFKVTSDGTFTVLHQFASDPFDGANPLGQMIQATDGNFYGTTSAGGQYGYGCLYRMTPAGDVFVLQSFMGDQLTPNTPIGGVVEGSDGNLYGSTNYGGAYNSGTIFKAMLSPPLPAIDSIVVTPGDSGPVKSQQFTATALDSAGNPLSPQPKILWSVSGNGVISPTGLFLASVDGPYTVTASHGPVHGTASGIAVDPVLTSIVVFPASTSVVVAGTKQFAATALEENNAPMPVQPDLTWSVDGGGAVDGNGLFTAGAAAGGPFTITVTSGGVSGTASITVANVTPALASISPTSSITCGPPVTLTVTGARFVNGATVKWNGAALATTFVSATQLTATVPGTDTSSVGTFNVTVDNPSPEVSGSNSGTFTVTANPLPVLVSITPASLTADTAAFTLTANGSGYTACSTVLWNGSALATTFVSATRLTAAVPAALLTAPGTVIVQVTSPAPGGGSSAAKPLTIIAPALSMLTLTPNSLSGGVGSIGKVTLTAPALAGGQTVTLTTTNAAAAALPSPPTVTVPAGALTATFPITTTPVSADTNVTITATLGAVAKPATLTVKAPVLSTVVLSPNSVFGGFGSTGTVTITGQAPAGGVTINLTSSNPGAAGVGPSVTVAPGATSATFPVTTTVVTALTTVTITAAQGAIVKPATLAVKAIAPSMVVLSPSSVYGGFGSTGTVTINSPAPAGGITLTLGSSNSAAASVGPSVTVAPGATTATFPITTTNVAAAANVTITCAFGPVSKTALLAVKVIAPTLVTVLPISVYGGFGSTGTVTLSSPAPAGGITVTLNSSNSSAASVGPSVTVAPGASTATFPITTSPVSATVNVTISAAFNGVTKTVLLAVKAPSVASASLTATPVHGGTATTLTITLTSPAPTAGTTVTLSSSRTTTASIQGSVLISSGNSSATVNVTTSTVTMNTAVTLTATGGGVFKTAVLTVTP